MEHIQSGEIGFSKTGEVFQTVLGSCVCICIYDPDLKMGGMIHFLLPDKSSCGNVLELTKNPLNFGDEAITALLKKFKNVGSDPARLKIYLFGGGGPIGETKNFNIGEENLKKARMLLAHYHLKIYKEKIGPSSMMVKLDSRSGDVYVSATASSDKVAVLPINNKSIKVLIVDDSAPIRRILRVCLSKNSRVEIIGEACDPIEAEELRKKFKPDVMTLDVNMPKKDGVTYLGEIMDSSPMAVIMVTDLNLKEASPIMKALELGAFDYIQKPSAVDIDKFGDRLNEIVLAASSFKTKKNKSNPAKAKRLVVEYGHDKSIELIAIGSSTGGTEAIRTIFKELPSTTPPIVIVQHIPASFSGAFAESLNRFSKIEVKEARDGDVITPNTAYIAPGEKQMKLNAGPNGKLIICITDDPAVNRFKPSVDYLFNSIARLPVAKKTKVAILTGMGDDGARGMLALKKAGASTVAQNEESCVVYGMPKVAVEMKAADKILDLSEIGYHLLKKAA